MGELLDRQHKFYLRNEKDFIEKYKGQFIVIHEEKFIETFRLERDAYIYCVSHFPMGTFLIREVLD